MTAIAEMKSGAVQAISGVGNPPVTEAIGNGTGVTVVMGWGFDDDQLLVPASVTSPAQLAGKSVAVLVGSSEDYLRSPSSRCSSSGSASANCPRRSSS